MTEAFTFGEVPEQGALSRPVFLKPAAEFAESPTHLEDGSEAIEIEKAISNIHEYFIAIGRDDLLPESNEWNAAPIEFKIETAIKLIEEYEGVLSGLAESLIEKQKITTSDAYTVTLHNDLLNLKSQAETVFGLHDELLRSQGKLGIGNDFLGANATFGILSELVGSPEVDLSEASELGEEITPFLDKVEETLVDAAKSLHMEGEIERTFEETHPVLFRNKNVQQAERDISIAEMLTGRIHQSLETLITDMTMFENSVTEQSERDSRAAQLSAYIDQLRKIAVGVEPLTEKLGIKVQLGVDPELLATVKEMRSRLRANAI